MSKYWIGVDPGGIDKFGLAYLNQEGELKCFLESSVDDAVYKIFSEIPENNVLGIRAIVFELPHFQVKVRPN